MRVRLILLQFTTQPIACDAGSTDNNPGAALAPREFVFDVIRDSPTHRAAARYAPAHEQERA
jgi:hypothetical protein